ncbi:MAG TPA: hypothetical protein VHI13_16735 [Candidatus Kapabacteria bacterium]|nr:hypothetical protein [Candidatus Kapabacteria bacterium]
MECPLCGSKKTITQGNPRRLTDWWYRDHFCHECTNTFTTRQELHSVRVPIPNAKGTFALRLAELDERMVEYLMRRGPFPGRPRNARDPQGGLFGEGV